MPRHNMFKAFAAATLLAASLIGLVHADDCQCSPETQRVTYLVVNMPDQAPSPIVEAVLPPQPTISEVPIIQKANTTHTFGPSPAPDLDLKDLANFVPKTNVSLYYSGTEAAEPGSINMTLALNNPAVVLEDIDAVSSVICGDDTVSVSFADLAAYEQALADWNIEGGFIFITNHLGNCDAEFERGFFFATNVSSNVTKLTIKVDALKEELANIAGSCEMTFSSLPAATLTRRLTLNPKTSLTFAEALEENTILYTDGNYVTITADEAYFTSTITFSGYLNYNFWGFKLKDLYFDIDTSFEASVGLSADVSAVYATSINYSPDELSYSLISVPGLVSLGPGIAFGVGVDLNVSAAVGVSAGLGVNIPNGNVHVDFLDGSKTGATGWEPQYNSYANITEAADVIVDASVDVTVELAIELLGGIVDLSSGITASPGFLNVFKLRGTQNMGVNGTIGGNTTAGVQLPKEDVCAQDNGVGLKSDFYFSLKAFATQWWSAELYSTTVPLWDVCYHFV